MRKASVILWVVLIVALVGFPGFAGGKPEGGKAESGMPFAGTQLNALLEGHPTVTAIQKLLPEFEKLTGIKVTIEILPFEEMTAKAYLGMSQKSDRYDVYMDHWGQGIAYAKNGYIQALDPYINDPKLNKYFDKGDLVPSFLNNARYENKQYGLPVYGESTFFYYRKDLFDKYGLKVPQYTDELMQVCETLAAKGEIYPITLRAQQGVHAVYIWCTFLWGFGGHWLDENGKLDIATPEAIEATKFYAMLLNKYAPPGYANFGWTENRVSFTTGKAAMSIDATVNGAFNEDPKESLVVGKVGYAPAPFKRGAVLKGGTQSLAAHHYYINNFSRNKEAAWLFSSWATSADAQIKSQALEPNSGATSLKAMQSTAYQEKFGAFREGMLEALKKGNPKYLIEVPGANVIYDKVGRALSEVVAGTKTAEQALKEVNEDINSSVLK